MHRRRLDPAALARLIADSGLSNSALARKAGISRSQIKDYLAGRSQPMDPTAAKIAKALRCRIDDFSSPTENEWAYSPAKMRKLLTRRDWTLAELSRQSGVSYPVLKNYMAGLVQPPMGSADKLAAALGCKVSDFADTIRPSRLAS